ncbi:hypothetical protein ACWEWI_27925 [Streptomyces sp. NPDC003753]|uniref:hypothetical protein n=1 Tax=unclassified Streptomyces TaxID=2593676 RepID=UPI001A5721C7|nr:hypothetical protein [Streptomyces sp. Y2F8-2]GHK04928.1 hypothetical protein SY2F82_67250 [Streptomyces sp. Y2F8-2]
MRFLGMLLLAATAAFTGLVIADNLGGGPHYTVSMFGQSIATMNTLAIFCAGLALALIFALGLATTVSAATHRTRGARRARRTTVVDDVGGPEPRH